MHAQTRDLAIVLRSIPYEERHRIVTGLTEQHGRVSALARNAIQSRRFGGALEPFAASEWYFTEKPGAELARLDEAHIRRGYEGLRTDFERLSMASCLNEFVLRLAPRNEPCPDLFKLLSNALAHLEETPGSGSDLAFLNAFLAKLLQWSGSQPQLQACLECGKPVEAVMADSADVALSCLVADAGWICPQCRASGTRHIREREAQGFGDFHIKITPAALADFVASLSVPIRQATSLTRASSREHRDLFKFIEALFVYHLPGFDKTPLKSLRFLGIEGGPTMSGSLA